MTRARLERLALAVLLAGWGWSRSSAAHPGQAVSSAAPLVREERTVQVNGQTETWRLEWAQPPKPFCATPAEAREPQCRGLAYGEGGSLHLIRLAGGREVDRLALTPLFRFGIWGDEHGPKEARLPHWPVAAQDTSVDDSVRQRPPVTIMNLGDYDHDGQATEFVLPLGPQDQWDSSMLIGLDRKTRRLKAFATEEHPERPLVLQRRSLWEDLKNSAQLDKLTVPCKTKAAPAQVIHLRADASGLHVLEEGYNCANVLEKRTPEEDSQGPDFRESWTMPTPQHFPLNYPAQALLREERVVVVDGHRELWQVIWKRTPRPDCANCDGFERGGEDWAEGGDADLIRIRGGREIDRLSLSDVFKSGGWDGVLRLRHWKEQKGDDPSAPDQFWERPPLPILDLQDYDHDGKALEFVVEAMRAYHRQDCVLIGIDRRTGRLKAYASVEEPAKPLFFRLETWRALLQSPTIDVIDSECAGNASSDTITVHVQARPTGLHVQETAFTCFER